MSLQAGADYTGAQLLQCLVHPMEFIGFDADRGELPLVMSPAVLPCLDDCPVLPCASVPFDCSWCVR
jgi:hypothetical protein